MIVPDIPGISVELVQGRWTCTPTQTSTENIEIEQIMMKTMIDWLIDGYIRRQNSNNAMFSLLSSPHSAVDSPVSRHDKAAVNKDISPANKKAHSNGIMLLSSLVVSCCFPGIDFSGFQFIVSTQIGNK